MFSLQIFPSIDLYKKKFKKKNSIPPESAVDCMRGLKNPVLPPGLQSPGTPPPPISLSPYLSLSREQPD